jgi:hypothetical protein
MEELVARLTSTAGIDAETAQKSIGIILGFLKKEAPAEAVDQLVAKLPGAEEAMASAGQGGGGLAGMIGGLMGGGGIMGLGTQLMGAGLNMDQMRTVGRELFAHGREHAGEDVMGEILGAVPGLGQFV